MKEKKIYTPSNVTVTIGPSDIITYSEAEEWEGPVIEAGLDDQVNSK